MKKFNHVNATSIDEATSAMQSGNAAIIAGGTDLLGTLRFYVLPDDLSPDTLVNIKTISPSLDYIREEGGTLKIGACTRLEDIAKSGIVQSKWAALAEAAHKTASPHLRESGTIGGNICQKNRCWYFRKPDNRFDCIRKGGNMCYAMAGENRYHSIFGAVAGCVAVNPSDVAPALVAFNATIKTSKKDIPVEEFWGVGTPGSTVLEKDEIVTEIQVPGFSGKSAFVKFALRTSIDFPVVNCAAAVDGSNVRICLNAVHPNPYRAIKAEEAIAGKEINEENAEAAGTAAITGTFPLEHNKWKFQIAKIMVKRALLGCA